MFRSKWQSFYRQRCRWKKEDDDTAAAQAALKGNWFEVKMTKREKEEEMLARERQCWLDHRQINFCNVRSDSLSGNSWVASSALLWYERRIWSHWFNIRSLETVALIWMQSRAMTDLNVINCRSNEDSHFCRALPCRCLAFDWADRVWAERQTTAAPWCARRPEVRRGEHSSRTCCATTSDPLPPARLNQTQLDYIDSSVFVRLLLTFHFSFR